MYLIDTSVWIDFLKKQRNPAVIYFQDVLTKQIPFYITSIIYQEVLQGASSAKDFEMLSQYLGTQRFVYPKDARATYQSAAKRYMDCRKNGITIRSTIDCLIAEIAIEHELFLLHNDKDFPKIKKIIQQLKLYNECLE